jgi:hypothetical protein
MPITMPTEFVPVKPEIDREQAIRIATMFLYESETPYPSVEKITTELELDHYTLRPEKWIISFVPKGTQIWGDHTDYVDVDCFSGKVVRHVNGYGS